MNVRQIFHLFFWAAVVITAVSSCGDDDGPEFILKPSGGGSPSVNPPTNTTFDAKLLLEVPALKEGNAFICHKAKVGKDSLVNYCVEYDTQIGHSRWVAFRFDNVLAAKSTGRKDYEIKPQYPADPDCPKSLPDDAYFLGYDHGHICASADRLCSQDANWQTFYMTNMSPQYRMFNQEYWVAYEGFVQGLARRSGFADTLYVVKGGTIAENQRLGTLFIDNRNVPIPKYYFIAMLKVKNNAYTSIGLLVEHEQNPRGSGSITDISQHAMSIDELEEKTGIDFFHNLPDNVENAVESVVTKSAWGL